MVKDRLGREIKFTEEQAAQAAEALIGAWLRDDVYTSPSNNSNEKDDNCK